MTEEFDWLPGEGVALTRADLERIFGDIRALVIGTDALDPNRAYAVTISQAIERDSGGP